LKALEVPFYLVIFYLGWEEGERFLIACSNNWKNTQYLDDPELAEKIKTPEYWQAHNTNETGLITVHNTDLRVADIPAEFLPASEAKE